MHPEIDAADANHERHQDRPEQNIDFNAGIFGIKREQGAQRQKDDGRHHRMPTGKPAQRRFGGMRHHIRPGAGNEVLEQGVHQEFSIVQFSHKINNRGLIFIREINGC